MTTSLRWGVRYLSRNYQPVYVLGQADRAAAEQRVAFPDTSPLPRPGDAK